MTPKILLVTFTLYITYVLLPYTIFYRRCTRSSWFCQDQYYGPRVKICHGPRNLNPALPMDHSDVLPFGKQIQATSVQTITLSRV